MVAVQGIEPRTLRI